MGRQPLSCPFFFAVGLRPGPDEPAAELRALADYYDTVHLAEVVRLNEGFVSASRYELTDPVDDETVPSWLAVYGIESEDAARRFLDRQGDKRPVYTTGPPLFYTAPVVWRMVWARSASSAPGSTRLTRTSGEARDVCTSTESRRKVCRRPRSGPPGSSTEAGWKRRCGLCTSSSSSTAHQRCRKEMLKAECSTFSLSPTTPAGASVASWDRWRAPRTPRA